MSDEQRTNEYRRRHIAQLRREAELLEVQARAKREIADKREALWFPELMKAEKGK